MGQEMERQSQDVEHFVEGDEDEDEDDEQVSFTAFSCF